jgi:uncharacterized protein YbaR (Trm112 family)
MDKKLLSILCCPITHKGLFVANGDLLERVNLRIQNGELKTRDGAVLSANLAEALVTDDKKLLYPVRDGIPVLLEGESVSLETA